MPDLLNRIRYVEHNSLPAAASSDAPNQGSGPGVRWGRVAPSALDQHASICLFLTLRSGFRIGRCHNSRRHQRAALALWLSQAGGSVESCGRGGSSKPFEHPYVADGVPLPKGQMPSVGRGDAPSRQGASLLAEKIGMALQVNIDMRCGRSRPCRNKPSSSVSRPLQTA